MDGFKSALSRDIIHLCIFIFIADILSGLIAPTFSLYAEGLGASLVLIGALSSAGGLTSMFSSIPLGALSDQVGRRWLLLAGMVTWGLMYLVYSVAPNAYFLFPGRVFMGLAIFLTFAIGAALLGDITSGHQRGYAFGLLATAQGLGFAIGPLIGGWVSSNYSIEASYQVAALISMVGFAYGWRTLPGRVPMNGNGRQRAALPSRQAIGLILGNPFLLLACLGVLLQTLAFGGAVSNFLPIYADRLLITEAAIGTMFSLRAFGSTAARMPMGIVAAKTSPFTVVVSSLFVVGIALFGISQSTSQVWLTVFLVLEGVGFGGLVTSGQAFVADYSTTENRGTAIGVYQMSSGIGNTAAPLILGIVADLMGVASVFWLTATVLVAGGVLMLSIFFRQARRAPVEPETGTQPGSAH